MLTRDRDDVLRAFANVCRHRGSLVARGAGERGTLQCPYHAWTYGLDGCLRAAPRTRDDPGFDTRGASGSCRWRPAPGGRSCSSTPTPDAAPLERGARRPARGRAPRTGSTSTRCVFHHRVEYEIRANWKIALENYLECYHCQLNHPGLVSRDRRPPAGASRRPALRASQFNPAHPDHELSRAASPQRPVPPALPALKFNVAARARRTSRSARSGRSRPTAAAASSTTSSRRTRPRSGSRSSSPSTTRSAPRTPRWSRAPRRARAAGSCRRAGCSRTTSS